MERYNDEKLLATMKRLVEETQHLLNNADEKIEDIISDNESGFPVSKDTWYKYKTYITSENKKKNNIKAIKIGTLYDFCQYINVSADYLLGFNDCKVKEASAQQIIKDFGLPDDVLRCFSTMKNHSVFLYKTYSVMDFINFFVVHFAEKFVNSIINYLFQLDEFEKFKMKYFDDKEQMKEEYSLDEARLIDEFQDLEEKAYFAKYVITQQIDTFIKSFRDELKR